MDAPAKVTLHLRILRRLSDGYHEVRIALAAVSLYDRVDFTLGGSPGLSLEVKGEESPAALEDNLVGRAALAFQAEWGQPLAAALRLDKRTPAGAGLGGGSGNAAATLVALNRWHGHPFGPDRLAVLAQKLGADVPFFLEARPAWAEGIGERLMPLGPLPTLELLVIKPPLSIATGKAYAAARSEADGGPVPTEAPRWDGLGGISAGLFNAFEPALLALHPVLGTVKAALLEAGAQGALLSGSGSAVFGLFGSAALRDAAAARLAPRADAEGWRLLPCHTLNAHRYDFVF